MTVRKRIICPPQIEDKYPMGYFDGATQGEDKKMWIWSNNLFG